MLTDPRKNFEIRGILISCVKNERSRERILETIFVNSDTSQILDRFIPIACYTKTWVPVVFETAPEQKDQLQIMLNDRQYVLRRCHL